jgi:hypothetical protein
MLEPVHGGKQKHAIEEAQPDDADFVALPGGSSDHVKYPCSNDKVGLQVQKPNVNYA